MAPLFFHFPTDENSFSIDDAFMVGEGLLVHPVVHEGASSVDVYLPEGTWYLHDDWKVRLDGSYIRWLSNGNDRVSPCRFIPVVKW